MKRNGNAERRRRENSRRRGGRSSAAGARRKDRGAEGVEGDGVWGGGVPSPPRPLPRKKISILALNMVSFGAFWMVFFTVQLPVLHAKTGVQPL